MISISRSDRTSAGGLAGQVIGSVIAHREREAHRIDAELTRHFLERTESTGPRAKSKLADGVRAELIGMIEARGEYRRLRSDPVFMAFAGAMCHAAVEALSWTGPLLAASPQCTESFIEHLQAHYELLKDLGLNQTILEKHAHRHSLW